MSSHGHRAGLFYRHFTEALEASPNVSHLVLQSWPCRICQWAVAALRQQKQRTAIVAINSSTEKKCYPLIAKPQKT